MIQAKHLARSKPWKRECVQTLSRCVLRFTFHVPGTMQDTGNLTVQRKDSCNCFKFTRPETHHCERMFQKPGMARLRLSNSISLSVISQLMSLEKLFSFSGAQSLIFFFKLNVSYTQEYKQSYVQIKKQCNLCGTYHPGLKWNNFRTLNHKTHFPLPFYILFLTLPHSETNMNFN